MYWAEDGSKYTGEVVKNTLHGYGKLTTIDGDIFEGIIYYFICLCLIFNFFLY